MDNKNNNKEKFYDILGKAISSPSTPQKQAKSGGYSGKKTRLRKSVNTSAKRRGKSPSKSA